jgi:16S rRNA processing protein RimM
MYLVGYILKPQGIKGEVKVDAVSSNLKRFQKLKKVHIQLKNKTRIYPIENVRVSDRFVYLKFAGVDSRSDAEALRNTEILIDKHDLIQPGDEEYFVHDLIGCQVFAENKRYIGILSDIVQMSSNDVYIVIDENGKEYLIPAIKDVVKQVDIPNKTVFIHLLEGLIE